MEEPLENTYFDWLCAKVLDSSTREYAKLMDILFGTPFTWVVPADEHRHTDAVELRRDFLRERSIKRTALDEIPISIFEVLIAFANRASFQTDIPSKDWFWEFLTNLGLDKFKHISKSEVPLIEDVLYAFTWRIYEPNGLGGMFPIEQTETDQRELEIWYQFCEYIQSRHLV